MSGGEAQKDYMWLVKTGKGDFLVSVIGEWTEQEAMENLRASFELLGIEITETIPRKRASGPMEMACTLVMDVTNPLGYQFYGSKHIWDACGRGVEFEAERIRLKSLPPIG